MELNELQAWAEKIDAKLGHHDDQLAKLKKSCAATGDVVFVMFIAAVGIGFVTFVWNVLL